MTTAEAIEYLANALTAAMGLLTDTFMFLALLLIPVALTWAMFHTRDLMLGFPSAVFWFVLGGYCYQQSAITWDINYFIFFASMGMGIFCMYAMYGLRIKDLSGPDADEGTFFDEEQESDLRGDVERQGEEGDQPSSRVKAIRDRATRRRSQGIRKKTNWGEFK